MVLEVQWSVRERGSYEWVPEDCLSRCYPMSLVVLGQIQNVIRIGELHLVMQIMIVTRLFPRVDYRKSEGRVDTRDNKDRSMSEGRVDTRDNKDQSM